jgi:hypothetical protein
MADILELEDAMACQRDKAILWFFESTSCRVGTVTKLLWKDLVPTGDPEVPFSITIESKRLKGAGLGKYKGMKQITFLHKLAAEKLKNYKAEAQRKGYTITENSPIFIAYHQKDKTIKPLESLAINPIFDSASLTAWHDLKVKRYSMHDFRDFVQSSLESAGINSNIIAPMLAHKPKGIDFHYSSHDLQELLVKFKTALPYLLPQSVEGVKTELEETKAENKKIGASLEEMRKQIMDMQQQYENRFEYFKSAIVRDQQKVNESLDRLSQNKEEILAQ